MLGRPSKLNKAEPQHAQRQNQNISDFMYESMIEPKPQKEKIKIPYFKNQRKSSKSKSNQKQGKQKLHKQKNGHFGKMSELLTNIMAKHSEMKRKIEKLKREKQNKQNKTLLQLTFQPKIIPNPRYMINSSMNERNKSWDAARAKHFTSIKEQIVDREVKECTFTPNIISKPKSKQYLRKKDNRNNKMNEDERQNNEKSNLNSKFIKFANKQLHAQFSPKKKTSSFDFPSIKSMIKSQMSRIAFEY